MMVDNREVPSVKDRPVIILIHGAWHRPLHYFDLISSLRDKGYVIAAPALPTSGLDAAAVRGKTIAKDDVGVVKGVMAPFLQAGREIVMVCHSLGGLAGTDSVVGETIPERKARGLQGGIKSLVYLCAFAPPVAGTSCAGMVGVQGKQYPSWWEVNEEEGTIGSRTNARRLFYNDLDDHTADLLLSGLVTNSLAAFLTPVKHAASEITVPKLYIATRQDHAIPLQGQMAWAEAAGARIVEMDCGHSLFAIKERIPQLVQLIGEMAEAE